MEDYKCLRAAVMICATLVNVQTHRHIYMQRHTYRQLLTGYTISSASWPKAVCMYLSVYMCCVCLRIKQGGIDHNRCKLVNI